MQAAAAPPDASQIQARAKARSSALKHAPAASPPQTASLPPQTAGPIAPAAKPIARPATILLKNGMLTVKADNSDLGQILKAVAQASGMVVDGSVRSTPVYGVYGPLDPRDVLTDLLTGSGYNFIMVGVGQQGVPRELRLTLQSSGPSPAASTPAGAEPGHPENSNASPPEEELGPGAIEHVPPAPSEDPQERVQQNLQRLQQMQDKQSQQQPPQ